MLDIRFIRENKDIVAGAAKKKRITFDVNALIAVDDKRRALMGFDEKNRRAEQNEASTKNNESDHCEKLSKIVESMKFVKESLAKDEEKIERGHERMASSHARGTKYPRHVRTGRHERGGQGLQEIKTVGHEAGFRFRAEGSYLSSAHIPLCAFG